MMQLYFKQLDGRTDSAASTGAMILLLGIDLEILFFYLRLSLSYYCSHQETSIEFSNQYDNIFNCLRVELICARRKGKFIVK